MGCQVLCQGLTFNEGHHDKVPALVFTDVEDGANIGMQHPGRGACLALEALHAAFHVRGRTVEMGLLERHLTIQLRVDRPIDSTHAAGAEKPQDAVSANLLRQRPKPAGRLTIEALGCR
jgi:hypothetical protein